ncbi:MAG: glucose-6-phosphate isomerase [Elusimicrobia bacterium RIFOXYD2_FULL_34_15]|nr:MAG: glucose-6-phosphate isomerase [Elusimicrobia bacterium RIFOXYD2_FULL_34_15]
MGSIRLDYSNCMSDFAGEHGIDLQELQALYPKLTSAYSIIQQKKAKGMLGFMELPYKTEEAKKISSFAKKERTKFDDFVVIGIGGSALGNIAVQTALNHLNWNLLSKKQRKNCPRLFVPDNVDPELIKGLLDVLNLKKVVFNIISKSGTTAECLANFFILKNALIKKVGVKNWQKHVIISTDEKKGYLRELANKEGIASFVIPANVGGRFSVLSPVGLISAAYSGLNIEKLLQGAKDMDERCGQDITTNPAAIYAAIQYLMYQKGKKINVMMPYCQALKDVSDWFRQLWAESLGKRTNIKNEVVNIGPTPVKALGATDQHSQVQLYIEGSYDKVITFLSVEKYRSNVVIPSTKEKHYLEKHTLNELIKCEEEATRVALTKQMRPNCTITIPEVNEHTIGQIFYMLELATAYIGELFEINAFDQPGVELGKVLTYGLMGRSGFEKEKKEIEEFLAKKKESTYAV